MEGSVNQFIRQRRARESSPPSLLLSAHSCKHTHTNLEEEECLIRPAEEQNVVVANIAAVDFFRFIEYFAQAIYYKTEQGKVEHEANYADHSCHNQHFMARASTQAFKSSATVEQEVPNKPYHFRPVVEASVIVAIVSASVEDVTPDHHGHEADHHQQE